MKTHKTHGFTLIELLMVIAIIGILASILIPTVGVIRDKSNIAASKILLNQYASAIQSFKGQYNYYPFVAAHDTGATINGDIGTDVFVGTLSAKLVGGGSISDAQAREYGNRKFLEFYSFSGSDFSGGTSASGVIADRFDNSNIFIAIDGDGDGVIPGLPDPDGTGTIDVQAKVTVYVLNDPSTPETPSYYLYE